MSSYSRVFIVISVLYILTFFSPVFSQNCVPVGEKFNLTFSYTPKKGGVIWLKNGATFFNVAVDSSSGSGCLVGGNYPPGFEFYCEDGGAIYIMEITSKLSDKDVNFTTNPTVGSLVYTPIVDLTGTDTNLNQCPKILCDCNQPGEKEIKFTFSCKSTCTQDHELILQYQTESGPVQDLENNVNPTMVKCSNDADLYKSMLNYIVDSNHAVLGRFNSATNKVRLIVKMVFGGTNETVFETSYFYVVSSGSSSGGGCDWCIPVFVPIAVLACVICGCCIYFVICKKKKKAEEKKKKSDRQDEATELKDPKTQQTEGEIEKKQENH